MPAHSSTPKTDHAAEGLFGASPVQEAPDGAPARVYRNVGKGLSENSGQTYDEAHGRTSDSNPKTSPGGYVGSLRSSKP
jgi:hypothetical protein